MNYYDELKALFPSCLFSLFLSEDDEANVILGYLLLPHSKKELFLNWYSRLTSECERLHIPYITACDYFHSLPTYNRLRNDYGRMILSLEEAINKFKTQ